MDTVYQCAFINIGATGANGSDQGCFWDREPHSILPTRVVITWKGQHNDTKRLYEVLPRPPHWAASFLAQPLNARGWIFQERLLSRRMLHYGRDQLYWECRELIACETYPESVPQLLQDYTLLDIKRLDLGNGSRDDQWPAETTVIKHQGGTGRTDILPTTDSNKLPVSQGHEVSTYTGRGSGLAPSNWDAIVELYSCGDLTRPEDKLVALSGNCCSHLHQRGQYRG